MPVTIVGNNTPTAGGVVYGDGTNYASTAAGTSGQVLVSAGASAPSFGTLGTGAGGTGLTTVGTNGQVLQSNGTSLTWATPATGAMVLLASVAPTATTYVTFSTTFTSSYNTYLVVGEDLRPASADYLQFQFTDGSGTAITSGYGILTAAAVNTGNAAFSSAQGSVIRGTVSTTGSGVFYCWINGINTTNLKSGISYSTLVDSTTGNFTTYASAFGLASGTIGGFRLFWSAAGNWAAQGKVYVFGLKNA